MCFVKERTRELVNDTLQVIISERKLTNAETDPQIAYEKMMERFGDFHPDIVDALRKAERVSDWEIHFSKPLPHLHKHKAVLIGDAAHSVEVISSLMKSYY